MAIELFGSVATNKVAQFKWGVSTVGELKKTPSQAAIIITLQIVAAFALSNTGHADARSDARAWCANYQRTTGGQCNVEKCPCGFKAKRLHSVHRTMRFDICVCSSRANQRDVNRRQAEVACRNYQQQYRQPCWVVRNNCGVRRMPVAKFGDGPLVRYSACREKHGAERLKKAANELVMTGPHAAFLISQYRKWMAYLRSQADRATPLRADHIAALQRYYPRVDLRKVRIAYSGRLQSYGGCTTDCDTIYCGNRDFVNSVRSSILNAVTNRKLYFHELEHTEQCEMRGGRNRYAMMWFRHLAPGTVKAIGQGRSAGDFGTRIHDDMPMEGDADRKAATVCASTGLC